MIAEYLFHQYRRPVESPEQAGRERVEELDNHSRRQIPPTVWRVYRWIPASGQFHGIGQRQRFSDRPDRQSEILPFEVVSIDISAAENIDWIRYSPKSCGYWRTIIAMVCDEEIVELHQASQQFHVQTVEYEMLMQGFQSRRGRGALYDYLANIDLFAGLYFDKVGWKNMGRSDC